MKVIYTEAANLALDEFYKRQKKLLESTIVEEKSVFGDDSVEITSSDIKRMEDNMIFLTKKNNRTRFFEQLSKIYLVVGLLITILGLLYPYLDDLILNETQKIIVIFGGCMSLFSIVISLSIIDKRRFEKEQINRDKIEMRLKKYTEELKMYENLLRDKHYYEEHISGKKDNFLSK